jgi:hypothetical protein
MISVNLDDSRDHVLNASARRLQLHEVGLVCHARQCMPGFSYGPVLHIYRRISYALKISEPANLSLAVRGKRPGTWSSAEVIRRDPKSQ